MTVQQKIADYEAEILKLGTGNVHNLQIAQNISTLYGAKIALENAFLQKGQIIPPNKENSSPVNFERAKGEYADILPELNNYFIKKQEFRQGKATQEEINHTVMKLVTEINEFLVVLNANSCCESEREILKKIKI